MQNLTIFLEEKSAFTTTLESTLIEKGFAVEVINPIPDEDVPVDAVVLFHDNHNLDKRIVEIRDYYEKHQIAIHKIDLSGTLNVALTHLSLFLDRIQSKKVLFVGSPSLKDHPKMEVFKEKWTL